MAGNVKACVLEVSDAGRTTTLGSHALPRNRHDRRLSVCDFGSGAAGPNALRAGRDVARSVRRHNADPIGARLVADCRHGTRRRVPVRGGDEVLADELVAVAIAALDPGRRHRGGPRGGRPCRERAGRSRFRLLCGGEHVRHGGGATRGRGRRVLRGAALSAEAPTSQATTSQAMTFTFCAVPGDVAACTGSGLVLLVVAPLPVASFAPLLAFWPLVLLTCPSPDWPDQEGSAAG